MSIANISSNLECFDLRSTQIDLMTIQNRRFMFHPSGLLILGAEDMTSSKSGLLKSHAEEYGEVSDSFGIKLPPYDTFVRGWIGVGGHYRSGIIHFAPHVVSSNTSYFNTAFDFIEQALKNGFTGKCILRGFCEPWEQSISNLILEADLPPQKQTLGVSCMNSKKWFLEVVQDFDGTYYANMLIDGKRVTGLPEYVNYNTLRDAIREKTGVEILKHRDMKFQQSGRKKYAYIDATQERDDCRVTLAEINGGWKPNFDDPKPSLDQQIRSAKSRTADAQSSQESKEILNEREH